MNKIYYIKEIRDLSKNYDRDTQCKILDDLTDKFFDVDGIMRHVGILKVTEHWNEDCYADSNGDW